MAKQVITLNSDYLSSLFLVLLLIALNYSELNHDVLSELPFFTLDSQEFLKITGGWVHQSLQSLIESKDLFGDIISSPERESELQESIQQLHPIKLFYDQTVWKFFLRRKNTMDFL